MKIKLVFIISSFLIFSCLNAEIRQFKFSRKNVDLNEITRIISIDAADHDSVIAYADDREWKVFLNHNIPYRIILPLRDTKSIDMTDDDLRNVNWSKYPTYQSYLNMMASFARDYPGMCRIDTIGYSVRGKLLLAARITGNLDENIRKPEFFYTAQMHGDETAASVFMLRLIDTLLSSYNYSDDIQKILDETQIWINPIANPDGAYYLSDSSLVGSIRYNANSYDLNRNYPDPPHVSQPNTIARQPETLAMMDFASQRNFRMSVNFHGGAECVNYPWDSSPARHSETHWFENVSHEYADTARFYGPLTYMSGFNLGVTNGWDWYPVYGGRQDYMTYFHHCKEVTIELTNIKMLASSSLRRYWEYNKRSLLNYIKNMGQGIIADWQPEDMIPDTVEIVTLSRLKIPIKTETLFFHYPLSEGFYDLCFHYSDSTDTLKSVEILKGQLTDVTPSGITSIDSKKLKPEIFAVSPVYPNPFNPVTRFTISSSVSELFEVKVFDITGRLITLLFSGHLQAGTYDMVWNGKDYTGKEVSSGVYIIQVEQSKRTVRQKAVLIR